jgi:alkylation response protein AidB-like acyl-CoA dehydrogenase
MVAVQHELGRGVVPGPYFSSAILATTALQRLGSDEQKSHWLPRLAGGAAIATVAVQESRGGWDADSIALSADITRDGSYRLVGEKCFVTNAHVADLLIVAARTAGSGSGAVTLFMIEASTPGVSVRPMKTIDETRRLCTVRLERVQVEPSAILGTVGIAWPEIEAIADLGRVALCAEMVGGAERAFEMTTDYARTRVQFGKPIGAFQAIQHKCADMLVQLEGARSMTFAAATALADGDPVASSDASIAKAFCGEAYRAITTEAIQIHGGLGFTWELDMHLYYKRAKAAETLLGDGRYHRTRIADRTLEIS